MPETENTQQTPSEDESGFLAMSHRADEMQEQDDSRPARSESDEDEQHTDLVGMIRDEISARPIQAVAWAATAGLALGLFIAARAMAPRSYPQLPFKLPR